MSFLLKYGVILGLVLGLAANATAQTDAAAKRPREIKTYPPINDVIVAEKGQDEISIHRPSHYMYWRDINADGIIDSTLRAGVDTTATRSYGYTQGMQDISARAILDYAINAAGLASVNEVPLPANCADILVANIAALDGTTCAISRAVNTRDDAFLVSFTDLKPGIANAIVQNWPRLRYSSTDNEITLRFEQPRMGREWTTWIEEQIPDYQTIYGRANALEIVRYADKVSNLAANDRINKMPGQKRDRAINCDIYQVEKPEILKGVDCAVLPGTDDTVHFARLDPRLVELVQNLYPDEASRHGRAVYLDLGPNTGLKAEPY